MPHSTPTAAKSASPPPRGKGLGVGGFSPRKPRPGLEPGPRRPSLATPEVPGQARDGLSLPLAAALSFLLTTPTQAQVIPTGSSAADILLSQAITEHRVFLTCSALDPQLHGQILTNWQRDSAAAVAILTTNKVPPDAITAFSTAADPAALIPTADTPWADVKALCDTRPDWMKSYFELNFTLLDLKLPGAFQ